MRLNKQVLLKPLRRLHGTEFGTVQRGGNSIPVHFLDGVSHRNNRDDTLRTCIQCVDKTVDDTGGNKRAGRIMNQHTVTLGRQFAQSVENGILTPFTAFADSPFHTEIFAPEKLADLFGHGLGILGRKHEHEAFTPLTREKVRAECQKSGTPRYLRYCFRTPPEASARRVPEPAARIMPHVFFSGRSIQILKMRPGPKPEARNIFKFGAGR